MQTRIQDFDMAEGGRIDRNKKKKISFESIVSLVKKMSVYVLKLKLMRPPIAPVTPLNPHMR